MKNNSFKGALIAGLVTIAFVAPQWTNVPHAFAQSASPSTSSSELRAAVQAALLQDPRAQALPPAELSAMVAALTDQAQRQGVSATDIAWRPHDAPVVSSAPIPAGSSASPASILFVLALLSALVLAAAYALWKRYHATVGANAGRLQAEKNQV